MFICTIILNIKTYLPTCNITSVTQSVGTIFQHLPCFVARLTLVDAKCSLTSFKITKLKFPTSDHSFCLSLSQSFFQTLLLTHKIADRLSTPEEEQNRFLENHVETLKRFLRTGRHVFSLNLHFF